MLGSDCFAKRYGENHITDFRGYGSGGGRVLIECVNPIERHLEFDGSYTPIIKWILYGDR